MLIRCSGKLLPPNGPEDDVESKGNLRACCAVFKNATGVNPVANEIDRGTFDRVAIERFTLEIVATTQTGSCSIARYVAFFRPKHKTRM